MARLSIESSPSLGHLHGRISAFSGKIRSVREPLEQAVDDVVRPRIGWNFASRSAAGAEGWQRLADATPTMPYRRMHSAPNNPLLDVTGALKANAQMKRIWTFDGQGGEAYISNTIYYAKFVHDGAPNRGLGGGLRSIPPRPFFVINGEDINEIEQIFAEWFGNKVIETISG